MSPEASAAPQDAILEAAGQLFRRQGYSGTSMRQIARAAGYGAVSGLYNHFESKEAIFAALLERRAPYDVLLSVLEDVEGDTAETLLRNTLRAIIPVMHERLDFVQLMFIDLQEFDGQMFARFIQHVIPRFQGVLFRLLNMPGMRRDLSPAILMRTIASVTIGYLFTEMVVLTRALEHLPFPPVLGEEWLEGLVSILAHGMTIKDEES